jgi:hypothetical protein
MYQRTLLLLLTLSLSSLLACGDDAPRQSTAPGETADTGAPDTDLGGEVDATPDADATVEQDTSQDATEDQGGEPVDMEEADADLPEIVPLEPDPTFDEAYEGVGDQVVTTLVQTWRPRYGFVGYLSNDGRPRAPLEEFGQVYPQPGEPHLLRDQLALPQGGVTWTPGALPEGSRSALYSFVIADPQLIDMDSPAQIAKNAVDIGGFSFPAYLPQAELVPHLVDALVRSADKFQRDRPLDVVFVVGDLIENGQANELEWFVRLMEGGEVSSDSGPRDDVVPGPANDAYDPFIAAGFTEGTPWLSTIGNHDVLVNGNFPYPLMEALWSDEEVLGELEQVLLGIGLTIPGLPTAQEHPAWFPHTERAAFRVSREDFQLAQLPGQETLLALEPATLEADPARYGMDVCDYVALHRETGGQPLGHGFTQENLEDCTAWYTYEPVPGAPLRVISLSLGPIEGGPSGILARPYANGELIAEQVGDPRFDQVAFLEQELARARQDDVAVILMTHQASDSLVTTSALGLLDLLVGNNQVLKDFLEENLLVPPEGSAVSTQQFRQMLIDSQVVIAHLAGHNHRNRVLAICSDASAREPSDPRCEPGQSGQSGYWEITTIGTREFPHQGRFMEVVHVEGQLGALYLTLIDPHLPEGSFAELGRFITRASDSVEGGGGSRRGHRLDRNVLLPFALSPEVAQRWSEAPFSEALESETSLLEARGPLPPLPVWP